MYLFFEPMLNQHFMEFLTNCIASVGLGQTH